MRCSQAWTQAPSASSCACASSRAVSQSPRRPCQTARSIGAAKDGGCLRLRLAKNGSIASVMALRGRDSRAWTGLLPSPVSQRIECAICLGSEVEVALGQAFDLMGPDLYRARSPSDAEVRVVAFLLGDVGHPCWQ